MVYGSNRFTKLNPINESSDIFIEEAYDYVDVALLSEQMYDYVVDDDSMMLEAIFSQYEDHPQLLQEAVSDLIQKAKEFIRSIINKVKEAAKNFVGKVKTMFRKIDMKSDDRFAKKNNYGQTYFWADKKGDKDGWLKKENGAIANKKYEDDGDYSILVGKKLSKPFYGYEGIDTVQDMIDPFTKIRNEIKKACDKIKDVELKCDRLHNSNTQYKPEEFQSYIDKYQDELVDIEENIKEYIDDETKKLDEIKPVEYDTVTKAQTEHVKNISKEWPIVLHMIEEASKDNERDCNEYIKNLDPNVLGKESPMDNNTRYIRGNLSQDELNSFRAKVTRIMTYFASASEAIFDKRMKLGMAYVQTLQTNADLLAKEKIKVLREEGKLLTAFRKPQ